MGGGDEPVQDVPNGMPASALTCADWVPVQRCPGTVGPELAALPGRSVALRDARDPDGPALVFTYAEAAAFIAGAKDGDFDDLIG